MPLGSVLGGIISAGGASAAGSTAANAGNTASYQLINAGDAAAKRAEGYAELYQPWINAGRDTLSTMSGLASGDPTAQGNALAAVKGGPAYALSQPYVDNYFREMEKQYGAAYDKFGLSNFTASPGYQFRLDQGRNALANSGSARGMTMSGAQAKALTDYNQGSASQEYQNWVNTYQNWMQQYGGYNANLAQLGTGAARGATDDYYKMLSGLTNTGYDATKGAVNTNMQANDYYFRGYQQGVPAWQQGQNALAGSQAASANAMGQGISSAGQSLAQIAGFGYGQGWFGGGGGNSAGSVGTDRGTWT